MIGYRVVVMGKQYETKKDKNEKKKQMKKKGQNLEGLCFRSSIRVMNLRV